MRLLTLEAAAIRLSLAPLTVRRLIKSGRLEALRPTGDRALRVADEEVDRFISDLRGGREAGTEIVALRKRVEDLTRDRLMLARVFAHYLDGVYDMETSEDAWEGWEHMEKVGLAKFLPYDPVAHESVQGAEGCAPGDQILVLSPDGERLAKLGREGRGNDGGTTDDTR